MFHLPCCFLFCFVCLFVCFAETTEVYFLTVLEVGNSRSRCWQDWFLLRPLPSHVAMAASSLCLHMVFYACAFLVSLLLPAGLGGSPGEAAALSWDIKAGGKHTQEYSPKGQDLAWAPCSWNVSVTLHQEVGVPVLSPWNWANLCNCLDQKNAVKLTLCDFQN